MSTFLLVSCPANAFVYYSSRQFISGQCRYALNGSVAASSLNHYLSSPYMCQPPQAGLSPPHDRLLTRTAAARYQLISARVAQLFAAIPGRSSAAMAAIAQMEGPLEEYHSLLKQMGLPGVTYSYHVQWSCRSIKLREILCMDSILPLQLPCMPLSIYASVRVNALQLHIHDVAACQAECLHSV